MLCNETAVIVNLLLIMPFLRTLFVLDTPDAGKLSHGRQLTDSIGISPPRLHCDRAANYGSIIIPCICYRHLRELSEFGCVSIYRSLIFEVLAYPQHRLTLRLIQVMYVINGYSIFKNHLLREICSLTIPIKRGGFEGVFSKNFLEIFSLPLQSTHEQF